MSLQSQLPPVGNDLNIQWQQLQNYTTNQKEAYFLRYLVKIASKEESDDNKFTSLFMSMKMNLFGTQRFFSSNSIYEAQTYINTEIQIRNFDLILFWRQVRKDNPFLNLPELDDADQIRFFLESNPESVTKITVLQMNGIFETWSVWYEKYGESLGFPSCETEKEIHDYLEDDKNKDVIRKIISKELDTILEKTSRLPPEIKYFAGLEKLTYSNRKAWVLPKEVFTLSNLKVLNVRHSELRKLSKKIGGMKQLKKLRLIGAQFEYLPRSLSHLKRTKLVIENKD
ncbi:MAG: hypothetical protein WC222_06365 [Parachlamydiales bacterium]